MIAAVSTTDALTRAGERLVTPMRTAGFPFLLCHLLDISLN
jgi:hypothetical protein